MATAPGRVRLMQWVRRLHLYLGLSLFPWAILYGVTAFLFNHPTAFPDAPTVHFGPAAYASTPLEDLPTPSEQATAVVTALNAQARPAARYAVGPGIAEYAGRGFLFATARAGDRTFSLLYEVRTGTGTVRETTVPVPVAPEPAPFAVRRGTAPRAANEVTEGGLDVPGSVAERFRDSGPTVLERCGFPRAEVTVTSTPDLSFPIVAGGVTWAATYNPLHGTLGGVPAGSEPVKPGGSSRRFLLRLHTAHGYPGAVNARWFWAALVDVMAFAMAFWGVSGLLMWWQLKATRRTGAVVLALSAAAAAALAVAMSDVLG